MRVAVGIPLLFPWGCSHTLAWRALKIGELLFARGHLGFLGISGQEVDEGCDLSASSVTPFWSPVNFQSMILANLGPGWASVLVEGPAQLLRDRRREEEVTLLTKTGPHLSVSTTVSQLPCLQAACSEGPPGPSAAWGAGSRAGAAPLACPAGDLP